MPENPRPVPRGELDAGVDPEVLAARQIRLYIENSPRAYPATVAVWTTFVSVLLWQYVADAHPRILLWDGLIAVTVLMRISAWSAFLGARPEDGAIRPWLKRFFLPQLIAMLVIAASPFFFLQESSGYEVDKVLIVALAVYIMLLTSSLKLASYRPLIAPALVPVTLLAISGLLRLSGLMPKMFAAASLGVGGLASLLAMRFNQALVRSMALTLRNQQLVTALELRTAQLQREAHAAQQAKQAALHAERDKTRFLAAASHDLRQPMHAISLLVGMLRPRASEAEREVVERLERSVESMEGLFSTILDLSKLDAGVVKPDMAAVPLSAVFDSIEVHFAPQAAAKNLALKVFASRAIVDTDRAVLERLLRNLVSNAIKYTREGKVLVGCRRRGAVLKVAVWDTGVGIAAEDLGRIFEEYFRAGAGPRDRSEGLGLGLSIVRRLAQVLGSDIAVRSAPGRGSVFGLTVPFAGYARASAEVAQCEREPDAALAGKFILVVDDEADVRFGTEAALRRWGARSVSAGSLEELAAVLERELRFPDAVLTDYRVDASHTGLDVIAVVRRHTGERTPGVIVSGEDLGVSELGVDGELCPIVRKPVASEELRRRLVAALREPRGWAARRVLE